MSLPLSQHRVLATDDLEQARAHVGDSFCSHRLGMTQRDGRLDLVHHAASIGDAVQLHYLRYGDEVRITPGTFDDFFLAQIPLAGSARVKVGDDVVVSDRRRGSLGSPTEPVDMVWSADCAQLMVYLRRDAVEEQAGAQAPVVFRPTLDLGAAPLRAWMRLVRLAVDDLEAGGSLFATPSLAGHFESSLILGLLAAQPNSTTVAEADDRGHLSSRAVARVVELIESDPAKDWRVAELAEHAGVAPRTLQESFQRELDLTPMEQVRRTRLDRARRDLTAADPTSSSVTEVAARWGFFHLGRFSQRYRETFQELPSQTLAG